MFSGALDSQYSLLHSRRVQWLTWEGGTSLQALLALCQGPSPAVPALQFLCQVYTAKAWVQACILHAALPISPGTLSGVDRVLQRWGHCPLKPLHTKLLCQVLPACPALAQAVTYCCLHPALLQKLNPSFCWLANVSLGDCHRQHWGNKIRLSSRPFPGSEKFRRFQNNLLLAGTLNLPTKLTLGGHKAINQALTSFESTVGFFISLNFHFVVGSRRALHGEPAQCGGRAGYTQEHAPEERPWDVPAQQTTTNSRFVHYLDDSQCFGGQTHPGAAVGCFLLPLLLPCWLHLAAAWVAPNCIYCSSSCTLSSSWWGTYSCRQISKCRGVPSQDTRVCMYGPCMDKVWGF